MRRRGGQSGRAILETALVLSAFLMMLIVLVDVAQLLLVHASLTERVRAAARFGANTMPLDERRIRNWVLDAGFRLRPENVQVRQIGQGTEAHRLEVRVVNYRFTAISPAMAPFRDARPIVASHPLGINE